MTGLRRLVPWWLRIGAKLVLSRLPVPYTVWKRLRLFEHGDMNDPCRAFDTLVMHAGTAGVLGDSLPPRFACRDTEWTMLELGPGDSLFSGVIAKCLGASRSWLVDTGAFATLETREYAGLARLLVEKGYECPSAEADVEQLKAECNIVYLTDGIRSLRQIPDASVDFCFSNAVLEHVPRGEFPEMLGELRRILKVDGVCVHRVDLKDHLGGGLNNLRFSEEAWEGPLLRKAGFYTNRIRCSEMLAMFGTAGFACQTPRITRWDHLPTSRERLVKPFRELPDEELRISGFDVLLRHHVRPEAR